MLRIQISISVMCLVFCLCSLQNLSSYSNRSRIESETLCPDPLSRKCSTVLPQTGNFHLRTGFMLKPTPKALCLFIHCSRIKACCCQISMLLVSWAPNNLLTKSLITKFSVWVIGVIPHSSEKLHTTWFKSVAVAEQFLCNIQRLVLICEEVISHSKSLKTAMCRC